MVVDDVEGKSNLWNRFDCCFNEFDAVDVFFVFSGKFIVEHSFQIEPNVLYQKHGHFKKLTSIVREES